MEAPKVIGAKQVESTGLAPSSGPWPMTALPAAFPPPSPLLGVGQELDGSAKRRRSGGDQAGDTEEEAGLTLAGMGLGLSGGESSGEGPHSREATGGKPSPAKNRGKKAKPAEIQPDGTTMARKSCAECRRMKAKCDRVFPCSNCRKRGCALACPDLDLSCMQGKRLVLADTEQLHDRVAELEAALAQAHRQIGSSSPHPLLTADHLDGGRIKSPPANRGSFSSRGQEDRLSPPTQRSSSRSSYALRTPHTTGEYDRQNRMAVEHLLIDEGNVGSEGGKDNDWVGENAAPALIVGSAASPQDATDRQAILDRLRRIVRVLPDRNTTRRHAERFWSQSTWYQNILRRDEFEAIYEPAVYSPTPTNPLTPHKLACVLMLLTLDTYFDLTGSQDNPLIGEYWDGVQRCFDTRFGWGASVAGVQALGLASLFVGFGWRGAGASNYYWLRMMTSAAQQLGLHKDPHPSMPIMEQTFRRRVFHEMYTLDCLMSINHGQRTAIPHENIETKYPDDNMPLCKLKYLYMGHVKSQVIEIGCAPESVSKQDLEDKVQKLSILLERYSATSQPEIHCPVLSRSTLPPLDLNKPFVDVTNMTKSTTSMCHFKSLMFLHRPSLRRLIARLRTQRQMVLTDAERMCIRQTFEASTAIIAISGFISKYEPRLAARLWSTWVQTFSAAVSLAALAIWCGPFMDEGFVRRAYAEMRGGCEMIRDNGCYRAQGVLSLLPILCNLVENRYPSLIGSNQAPCSAVQQGEDMLFVLLGGQVGFPSAAAPPSLPPPNAPQARLQVKQDIPRPASSSWINSAPVPHSLPGWIQPSGTSQNSFDPASPNQMITPPNFGPFDGIPAAAAMGLAADQAGQQPFIPSGGPEAAEIWARLQTFYEPALPLPFWNNGQGQATQQQAQTTAAGAWGFDGAEFGIY